VTRKALAQRRWVVRAVGVAAALPLVTASVLLVEVELASRQRNLPDEPLALDGVVGAGTPGAPIRVVWLGDSTAAGVGASGIDAALPRQVAEGLERPVELTVLAVSGDRVSNVLDEQLPKLAALEDPPELVFISVGANDVTHLTGPVEFRRTYRAVLDALPAPAQVVMLGVPDMGSPTRLLQPLRFITGLRGSTIDDVVRALARDHHATYVDIAGKTGPAFRRDPGRYFAADGYHPNDEGYRLWKDAVLAALHP
jgi:lysophospholipase L1-like esterase